MTKRLFTLVITIQAIFFGVTYGQNVGIGETNPGSKLSVKGNFSVGSDYSPLTGPSGGAIIEGQVGIGTSSPDTTSIFQIYSTNKGVLIPRLNTINRATIVNPATGLLIYNTDSA